MYNLSLTITLHTIPVWQIGLKWDVGDEIP